jgi:hypothetical protein
MSQAQDEAAARRWPAADDRRFYIQRGIPLVPLLAILAGFGVQTILGVRYISGLESKIEAQGKAQGEFAVRMEKFEGKLDTINNVVQQGSVPAALNQRAIADLERITSNTVSKLSDKERRLAALEVRQRATRER